MLHLKKSLAPWIHFYRGPDSMQDFHQPKDRLHLGLFKHWNMLRKAARRFQTLSVHGL